MIKIDNNKIHILRLCGNHGSYGNYKIKRYNKADGKQMTQKHNKKICSKTKISLRGDVHLSFNSMSKKINFY